MPGSKYKSNSVVASSLMVIALPLSLAAAGYPSCSNNSITLPGQNGPELWSCIVAAGNDTPTDTSISSTNNSQQTRPATSKATAGVSVEKRIDTSSSAMDSEIKRVLDQSADNGKRKIQKNISVGLQYATNRRDEGLRDTRTRSQIIPFGLGFSLTDRTSMSVTIPLVNKANELVATSGVDKADAFGVGDVSLNVTTDVLQETDKRPGLSLSFGVGAPTGKINNPQESTKLSLGSGFWSASAGATVSKRFDPATVFASIRYQHVFGDEQFGYEVQPGSSFEYGYGLGLSLNNALSVSGRIAGAIHRNASVNGKVIEGSNSEPLEFVTTSSLRLNRNSRLESNLAFGLNKDSSDARLGLTLTKDF